MAPTKLQTKQHIDRRKHRASTNKLLDRLTYSPNKHKQKKTRELRKKLQEKALPVPLPSAPTKTLKFGSFNVNGLDIESSWAVEQLLERRGYDVSGFIFITSYINVFIPRSLH